jgi:NADPH:quinone reductase
VPRVPAPEIEGIVLKALRQADETPDQDLSERKVLPGGFDVVFDGIGEDGYRRSFAALKRGGLLCAIGYSAGVQAQRSMLSILIWIARLYLWRWLPGGKRARFYSINAMRARHPAWFREDLERLFELLASAAIRPRVAERISFDEVAEAHRRVEAGGLEGKLVLCPDLASRRDRASAQRPTLATRSKHTLGNRRSHSLARLHDLLLFLPECLHVPLRLCT